MWLRPIARLWGKIQTKDGATATLFPRLDGGWDLVTRRFGTHGTVQAALTKLELVTGFTLKLKLQPTARSLQRAMGSSAPNERYAKNLGDGRREAPFPTAKIEPFA